MMSSVCDEQQHKSYLTKKALREIDIPPRKLLGRRSPEVPMVDSPAAFSKFLAHVDDDDSSPYSSDHFRMFEFKVRKCNRSRSHDWTDCPFAHPGEKARRRDPRRFHYSGIVCSDHRKGHCGKGDNCELSHGVFECWLHPSRYRTEACKDGKSCKRKICFFAHSSRQLRLVPDGLPSPSPPPMNSPMEKRYPRCVFCRSMTDSPTSTLLEMSPPAESEIDLRRLEMCCGDRFYRLGYKEALTELMASFEAMNMAAEGAPAVAAAGGSRNLNWVDMNEFSVDQEQPEFVVSGSGRGGPRALFHGDTPGTGSGRGGPRKLFHGDTPGRNVMEESSSSGPGPDLDWVNDLLT